MATVVAEITRTAADGNVADFWGDLPTIIKLHVPADCDLDIYRSAKLLIDRARPAARSMS